MIRALSRAFFGLLLLLSRLAVAQVQEVVALAPAAPGGVVKATCYQKIELALSLLPAIQAEVDSGRANPYDPRDIDLTAELYAASWTDNHAAQPLVLGYYTERFRIDADGQAIGAPLPSAHPWRLRFSVARPGRYRLALRCKLRGGPATPEAMDAGLELVVAPAVAGQHGPLGFPRGQSFLEFADGTSFFAVGDNLPPYSGASQFVPAGAPAPADGQNTYPPYAIRAYRQAFEAMHANGANFTRIMLAPASFEYEWARAGNYTEGQNRAQDLDALLALAEKYGIYLQLTAFSAGPQLSTEMPSDSGQSRYLWAHNPYRQLPGVQYPIDLFRLPDDGCQPNEEADQLFANKLRYLLARWGYSPHLAVVELFNEFDALRADSVLSKEVSYWSHSTACTEPNYLHVERAQVRLAAKVRAWCPRMLITSSPAAYFAGQKLFQSPDISFVSYHFYNDLQNYSQLNSYVAAQELARYQKPAQWGEYGFNGAWYHAYNQADFRNPLWSSAFSGSFGTGLYFWTWGTLHHNWRGLPQGVIYFKPLATFFASENLARQPYQPLRTPLVPESAGPSRCLPGGIGPPECADSVQANLSRPEFGANPAYVVPDALRPSDPRLEAYALRNPERVLGWVHQREEYWYNLPHNNEGAKQNRYAHPDSTGQLPAGDQLRRYVSDLRGATLHVPGLYPTARYRLEWWHTLGDGGPRPGYSCTLETDAEGTALLPVPDLVAPNEAGDAPDYGFKLVWLPETASPAELPAPPETPADQP